MTEMVSVFDDLITAARAGDWGRVDSELVPKLRNVDNNDMAARLLGRINDPNPDIRDVIATSLTVLDITDRAVFEKVVETMIGMAIKDEEKFPAGRAAMFLWSHRDDQILREKVQKGINQFKRREEIAPWKNELVKNIPGISELFETAQ